MRQHIFADHADENENTHIQLKSWTKAIIAIYPKTLHNMARCKQENTLVIYINTDTITNLLLLASYAYDSDAKLLENVLDWKYLECSTMRKIHLILIWNLISSKYLCSVTWAITYCIIVLSLTSSSEESWYCRWWSRRRPNRGKHSQLCSSYCLIYYSISE